MSILVKAGAGLAAGVVAGALGLMLVPRLEPSAVRPRSAVEKPQFVVATPSLATSPQPVATLAVATEAPAPKSTLSVKPVAAVVSPAPTVAPAASPAPSAVAAPTPEPAAKPAAMAKVDPPAPVAAPSTVAVAAPAAPTETSASAAPSQPTPPDAARWSVRGLVALARGDISSARLFLTRAAEAGDARAWVALADTYDPAMLTKLGVVFAPGDPQRAKDCLVKAVAAGVVVPKDRLAALDQGERQVR